MFVNLLGNKIIDEFMKSETPQTLRDLSKVLGIMSSEC